MAATSAVFVVVPAFNERAVLDNTLRGLLDTGHQIVVVDDGSTDGTWPLLAQQQGIHRLHQAVNLGQGSALQTGTEYALARGAEYIMHFDADGQHRVADVEVLLGPLRANRADLALGSRFLSGDHRQHVPAGRRLLLQAARLVNWMTSGLWLTDAHNGFRALTRKAADAIRLQENGYAHATEILVQAARHKLRVVECPTCVIYTEYSRAKGQRLSGAVHVLLDLWTSRLLR